jgi:DNA-binding NarL/FixJ family response regulator
VGCDFGGVYVERDHDAGATAGVSTTSLVRVVIVDDQMLVREGLRRIFSAIPDFELVAECADGDEVVETIQRMRPDVVLMDMRMKRVDGASAISALSALPDRPPVLVLTTYDDPETLGQALRAGAEGFMLKESVALDLIRAVHTVAGGGAWIDPAVAAMVLKVFRSSSAPSKSAAEGAPGLTDRELEVLRLMAIGRTNREIADQLFISERTVKTHIGHIFTKLDVRDRVAAVLTAYEIGLAERPAR